MLRELIREIFLLCQTMLRTLIFAANTVLIFLELEGGYNLLSPDGLSGNAEAVISGKVRVGTSQHHYWELSFR